VTNRARRALQAAAGVACVLIFVSALTGSDLSPPAEGQVLDYVAPPFAPPPPDPVERGVPGVTNRVQAVSIPGFDGPVLVCRRPGEDCRELTGEAVVGIGDYLDTTEGAAKLETRRPDGRYTGMVVYAGLFRLQQARQRNAVLIARLSGRLPACNRASGSPARAGASATKKKKVPRRRLWSNGKGKFRATGRYGSATVRGTKFLVEERCAGTFVRVTRGSVNVADRGRRRTVVVRAPRSYLIRPRR
jgi:hypothetical protein